MSGFDRNRQPARSFFLVAPATYDEESGRWDVVAYNLQPLPDRKAAENFASDTADQEPGKIFAVLECVAIAKGKKK